ncbi:MAG TPA: enoyl-CoA hydratase-related protein, partial [Woeseiaceae bacterium]|nr:enoyl-CoA hydratase-related protein [Woeseiaceae bacterium]
ELGRRRGARVVVLTGGGKSFCSGADLEWMRSMANYTRGENRDDAHRLAGMMASLASLPLPVVARVNGAAFGGGVGLICCCDVAIASRRASFALTEVRLGLAPAVISPYVIGAIGVRQCRRYFQTGETIDAHQAVKLGLVHEAVEHEYLDTAVERQVRLLLKGGPKAQAANKRLIEKAAREEGLSAIIEFTVELIADLRVSPEGQEGVAAFLEKRDASFIAGT